MELKEARRNPHLNPKISAYEALKPYSDDPDYFISFTTEDKLGINPRSPYDTPLGIYTYPLAAIWKKERVSMYKNIGTSVPFAGNRPYVWLVKIKPNANIVDMEEYYDPDYERDSFTLKQYVLAHKEDFKSLFDEFNDESLYVALNQKFSWWAGLAKVNVPIMKLWNVTRNLAKYRKTSKNVRSMVQWNFLLRQVLGYDGFIDLGSKYIHENEPYQAVFLSRTAFIVEGQFYNKAYLKKASNPQWVKKASIFPGAVYYEKDGVFTWEKGVWEDGVWEFGFWLGGTWYNGTWKNGSFYNGNWDDGTWENGTHFGGKWYGGVWKEGEWKGGIWENGTWENGEWHSGTWENGTWLNGKFFRGDWDDGVWHKGTWVSGVWFGGRWKFGVWKYGRWEGGIWENGYWGDGVWVGGEWRDGGWKTGIWQKGLWKKGNWNGGQWHGGLWKNGRWSDGSWLNGTWKNGIWDNGIWHDGIWENGKWRGGNWNGGTWVKGKIWDNRKWVDSEVNPKEYFENKRKQESKNYIQFLKEKFNE